jgi:hypothetical protein
MNVSNVAVARDGSSVIYIVVDGQVRKSTNGGQHFINLSLPKNLIGPPRLISVAPDSSDTVAVVDSCPGGNHVWISTNGGNLWIDTGAPKNSTNAVVTDIAISPAMGAPSPGRHYFVTTADNRPGNTVRGDVMMRTGNLWTGIGGVSTTHDYLAIQASPEYLADQSVCVVGVTPKDGVDFQVINFGAKSVAQTTKFIPAGKVVDFAQPAAPNSIIQADMALGIDAVSMDERIKVAFISIISEILNPLDGIYRVGEGMFERMTVHHNDAGMRVKSLDFDGEGLIAGEYENTNVWISTNPLTVTPSWDKVDPQPAGEREAVVGIKSPNCYIGTSGKRMSGGFFVM